MCVYITPPKAPLPLATRGAQQLHMAAFKAHVKTVDMSEEMEADAIAIATTAIMEYSVEKEMASYVRCQPGAGAPARTLC